MTMIKCLLTGKFKWLPQDEVKKLDMNAIRKDNLDRCLLQVDTDYP